MITVITTMQRPDTSSAWWFDALTTEAAIINDLITDPLMTSNTKVVSEDALTVTKTATFNTYTDYTAWIDKVLLADPELLIKRNLYIEANNQTLKIEESVDGNPPVIEKQL